VQVYLPFTPRRYIKCKHRLARVIVVSEICIAGSVNGTVVS